MINVAIIGGSGFWSELNHIKNILNLSESHDVTLRAIVDPVNPTTILEHPHLQTALRQHKPTWIDPTPFSKTDAIIKKLKEEFDVSLVIIASNPTTHYDYGMSCMKYSLHTICDKPIVTIPDASTNPAKANKTMVYFDKLDLAYKKAKKQNKNLIFHSILRRRSLQPFQHVAHSLSKTQLSTNAGINNMTIQVNGGIYKFPLEFLASGAHGYTDGVGSLAHSAYHYIDVLAWFIGLAPGEAVTIEPKLNHCFRVKDYIDSGSFKPLAHLLSTSEESLHAEIPDNVLGCELNSSFTFILKNSSDAPVGEITFLFNHVSFTPRTLRYDASIKEPANHTGGGRMSHFSIDINQGGLQSWQIYKNDIVFENNTIRLEGRQHPLLSGASSYSRVFHNAYETESSMESLFEYVIEHIESGTAIEAHPVIRSISDERLAMEIYSACYILLANNYSQPRSSQIPLQIAI